ncbi:Uncharacterised protein [Capnocytophaga ochracea]|uniref:Uncharacterized protein n=1 Tax=Capnocytophaga ochracea TaxID=1018 RepID=A0A2X2ST83_CAPOC|nr:Uncharacterised protein [Capnocytophaga ochracea]
MWFALSLRRYTPFSSMDFAKVSDQNCKEDL